MTVDLIQKLSLLAFILAGFFLFISLALYFILDLRSVMQKLSPKSVQKAIAKIKEDQREGKKSYRHKYNTKVTAKIVKTEDIIQNYKLAENLDQTQLLENQTVVLAKPINLQLKAESSYSASREVIQ